MEFVGVDLAWGDVNETGVVACDATGTVLSAGWTVGVEATVAWIEAASGDDTMVFVDAPLVVPNEFGQRLCEREVGQRYGRWKVSANSTNQKSTRRAGLRLRDELELRGWRYDDGSSGPSRSGRTFSECYPYTTSVGAEELGYDEERPLYKRGPRGIRAAQWRPLRARGCDQLLHRLGELHECFPPLDLRSHAVTAALLDVPSPLSDRDYKHREDLIDACIAAWTAALWCARGFERSQVLGVGDPLRDARDAHATIVAPARPEQRRDVHADSAGRDLGDRFV